MSSGRDGDIFQIIEHRPGKLLRLQTPGMRAVEVARNLLGVFEAELEAEMENTAWKQGYGPKAAEPVLIQLESLEVELSTDGGEVVLRRVAGSKDEFEDLCSFIRDQELDA